MAKDKMTICKHCGAEIAASAKTCPKCGGKNSKPIYKRVWFWILIAVLVIGIGGMAGGSDSSGSSGTAGSSEQSGEASQEKQEEQAIEYQEVSVETLFDALSNNAMNASDTYKNQYLSVTGVLGTIDSDGSYIAIESDNDNYFLDSITCYIKNDEQLEKVKSLSKGDKITVRGKVTEVGEVLGYSIDIDSIE